MTPRSGVLSERIPHTGYAQEQGGDYPRQQATTYHTSSGVPGKKLRSKNPTSSTLLTPPFCPRQAPRVHRDQRIVDSTSLPRQELATGRSYGLEQVTVAQVDQRLVSAVARPPYSPPTRLLLGGVPHYHSPQPLLGRSYKPRHGYARECRECQRPRPERGRSIKCRPVRWDQGNMIQAYLAGDVCHGAYRAVE